MGKPLSPEEEQFILQKVEEMSSKLQRAKVEISKEVWGQDDVIENTLVCMVAGGHLLSVGLPGLAKTRLVSRVARVMGLDSKRVQFTPDLMPSDILGSEIMEEKEDGTRAFRFAKGPIFTQFLMADEINRAGPRTQSALLEAMQERKVTAAGKTHTLKRPFTVMATQNPLEQEGTYPLPEAQMDRFMMKLDVGYPDEAAERKVMIKTTSTNEDLQDLFERSANGEDLTETQDHDDESKLEPVLDKNDLILMQKLARRLPLSEEVVNAAMQIVRNARHDNENAPDIVKEHVEWGPGPRAVQAFAQVAKARALMRGSLAPDVDDVLEAIKPVLEHRMGLRYSSSVGDNKVTFDDIAKQLTLGLK